MYLDYYGLSEQPFNLTPDPRFLYLSKQHEEAFAHLMYGIQNRSGFVMVSGEIGTGKTTICRSLLKDLDQDIEVALVFNPYMSPQELLKCINKDFGLHSDSTSTLELIDELNVYLLQCASEGKNCVLIIDEAQDLSSEILEQIRLLSNLETEKEKLLQIILIGQPELAEKLQLYELRQLNQRINARYHLEALDREETLQYIAFRLRVAGGQNKVRFARAAVNEVYSISKGTPRVINALCDRALLIGYTKETRTITAGIIKAAAKEIHGVEAKYNHMLDTRTILRNAGLFSSAALVVLLIILFTSGPYSLIDNLFDTGRDTASGERDRPPVNATSHQVDAIALVPDSTSENDGREPASVAQSIETPEPIATLPREEQTEPETKVHVPGVLPKTSVSVDIPEELVAEESEVKEDPIPAPIVVASVPKEVAEEQPVPQNETVSSFTTDPKSMQHGVTALLVAWNLKIEEPLLSRMTIQGIGEIGEANGFSDSILNSSLAQLAIVNRPALIQIEDEAGIHWVALTRLLEGICTVTTRDGSTRQIARNELEDQYRNNAIVLWRDANPEWPSLFFPNSGERIWTLQYELTDLGLMTSEPNGQFDQSTQDLVKRIQRSCGIGVDGIYGAKSRMVLRGWLDTPSDTPHLSPDAFSASARRALNVDLAVARVPEAQTEAPQVSDPISAQLTPQSDETTDSSEATYEPILPQREGPSSDSVTEPARVIVPLVPSSEDE